MSELQLKTVAALTLLLLLVGCGATPASKHYVLTASLAQSPSGHDPALGVGPIEIPEYLNRNTLAYREGGNQLRIASTERWAEPLEDGISRVLSLNLAGLLNTEDVRSYPWHPKRAPEIAIKLRVLGLDASGGYARLTAEWLLYLPEGSEPLVRKISQLEQPLPAQPTLPEMLAPAYSKLFYQLSELIAAAVQEQLAASD